MLFILKNKYYKVLYTTCTAKILVAGIFFNAVLEHVWNTGDN